MKTQIYLNRVRSEVEKNHVHFRNHTYMKLRSSIENDFNWLGRIKAKGKSDADIFRAIYLLKEEDLKDPMTRKAADILKEKECRDVFIKHGLLHLLRILSYSKSPVAAYLQPSLSYFNSLTGCKYQTLSDMYSDLMPKNYKIGEYPVFVTSEEELALNYKLLMENSIQKDKGRKRKLSYGSTDDLEGCMKAQNISPPTRDLGNEKDAAIKTEYD